MTVDYLIVGQGLAGSAAALALRARGKSVLVVDRSDSWSASRVAAGLITTLAGKSMNPGKLQGQALTHARTWYHRLEKEWGCNMLHDMPVLRLYDDLKQRNKLVQKKDIVSEWLECADVTVDLKQWHGSSGGFCMRHTGWLDTKLYLAQVRRQLVNGDAFLEADFDQADVGLSNAGVNWNGVSAAKLLLCQGAFGLGGGEHDWFGYVPHRSAKGDILTVVAPSLEENEIVNRNGWMIPMGGGRWKCGATYVWEGLNGDLLDSGREEVERRIRSLTPARFEVEKHEVGARPIIRKSQPVVGCHPKYNQLLFFNGLGSKGVIYAPFVAEHLAEHLVNGIPLDPMWDLAQL